MPRVHVALGVSPSNADSYSAEIEESIRKAFAGKNVKAIGSCGLTVQHSQAQEHAFARQIALAKELDALLVVEASGAYDEALGILEHEGLPRRSVILRSFDGTAEQLDSWVEYGCYISFGAEAENDPVAFCKLARRVPADRLLVESGAPDTTLLTLGSSKPRCDQVVFVADTLQGICPGPQLASNFLEALE